jgi:hypothetical protein
MMFKANMPEPEFIHQRASICEMEPKTNNLHSILLLQIYQFNPVFYKQCPEHQEKKNSVGNQIVTAIPPMKTGERGKKILEGHACFALGFGMGTDSHSISNVM